GAATVQVRGEVYASHGRPVMSCWLAMRIPATPLPLWDAVIPSVTTALFVYKPLPPLTVSVAAGTAVSRNTVPVAEPMSPAASLRHAVRVSGPSPAAPVKVYEVLALNEAVIVWLA